MDSTMMQANVVDVVRIGDLSLVAFDLIEGEVAPESVLKVEGSNDTWDVVGIKLPSPELHLDGRRGVTLRPARNDQVLEVGDILIEQ
jgi:hypothetical protein